MREILKSDGKKALVMNDEPAHKRPGPEPVSTHNVKPVTWEKRRRAAAGAVRAEAAAAKVEAERKAKNGKT